MDQEDFSWLPEPMTLANYSGDTIYQLELISNVFLDEIANGGLTIFNKPVRVRTEFEPDGKHKTLWHIITDPHNPEIKDIKQKRAERVCWIKPIIENYLRDEVLIYEKKKNGDKRLFLFIPSLNYVIILNEGKNYYYLLTAYYIDYTYKLQEFQKEYILQGPKSKTAA